MHIPDYYIEEKFLEHVGFPETRCNGDMAGCCPFCMEGKSWGIKKRFTFYRDKQALVCYNCGETHNAISFLKKIDNIDFPQLMRNIGEDDTEFVMSKKTYISYTDDIGIKGIEYPQGYVNLLDTTQQEFFKDDYWFKTALKEVKRRRLHKAKNRGQLWFSFDDWLHKNRLIIPFFNETNKLEFYQSRALTDKQEKEYGKYISSLNGKKIFWGLDRLNMNYTNIFLFEGPLDCFFVKNSFGGGGTKLNKDQRATIDTLKMIYDVNICLDNDFDNQEVCELYESYIKEGYTVFMWEHEFSDCKDINQYCIENDLDEVREEEILQYCYSGEEAMIILNQKRTELQLKNRSYDYFE